MKTTNALKLRQSLGKILKQLAKDGEPIIVEKDRKPAAVLIAIEDFQRRFADREADAAREAIVARIKGYQFKLPSGKSSLDLLHEGRK
jgi:prevent-host-death family protein